jgi:uncharacterized protein (TIGR02246 family)
MLIRHPDALPSKDILNPEVPMMYRATRTALPVLVVLAAACATTTRVDRASEEQRIRELDRQALQAAQSKDAAAFATLYAEDAVHMPSNAPVARGRDAIRNAWAETFRIPGVAVNFGATRVEVAESGDLAYVTGTYQLSGDMPGGRLDDRGNYVVVWKKIDGQWKAVADAGASEKTVAQLAEVMMPRRQEAAGAIAPPEPAPGPGAHFHARELVWRDGPPSLPAGAKIAVLEGDPMQPGPFTFRLRFPAGYRIPPHFHPVIEHATVVSGSLSLGQGERWDDSKLVRLDAGDFIHMPPGTRHFARANTETVIQLHSTGPWGVTYVNPADDPRK